MEIHRGVHARALKLVLCLLTLSRQKSVVLVWCYKQDARRLRFDLLLSSDGATSSSSA